MASVIRDNSQNPRIGCISSSKAPPCSSFIAVDLKFKGHVCTFATAGEAIPVGAVLRPSTVADKQVVQTLVADDITILGVAVEAAPSGNSVCMAIGGEFQVLVTGAITRGDLLSSSDTQGVAILTPGAPDQPGAFAIAMNSDANAAVKLVCARFVKAETY